MFQRFFLVKSNISGGIFWGWGCYLRGMGDVDDRKTRSYNKSRIREKDTKPEMLVRKFLHAQGFAIHYTIKNNGANRISFNYSFLP